MFGPKGKKVKEEKMPSSTKFRSRKMAINFLVYHLVPHAAAVIVDVPTILVIINVKFQPRATLE